MMNKNKFGIFLSLLFALGLTSTSCQKQRDNTKLVLNEVMVENMSSLQDDYGVHSPWIEVFNKAFSSADLAACHLKVSMNAGDTLDYFIPKGDVLTKIPPRQHALFWADGVKTRGNFHTNFRLVKGGNIWIGLFDSGNKLLDQITVPSDRLSVDQSYGRKMDGVGDWEIKDGQVVRDGTSNKERARIVTPSTNNLTLESNAKMDHFSKQDPVGIGMAISAMGVVFVALILLYLCFRTVGNAAKAQTERNAVKKMAAEAPKTKGVQPKSDVNMDEVMAVIAMALHEAQGADHDMEEMVLTIHQNPESSWASKANTMRQMPVKK